ncbi:putative amidoligase enzyme-domain-containing protein [Ilyonectria destructans]|nr:putative amidoligase enzyme-domain-containing protein [Ilyonectria destructans]
MSQDQKKSGSRKRSRKTQSSSPVSSSKPASKRLEIGAKDEADDPMCPPRVSFGVEIELMIGEYVGQDPDLQINGAPLPPQSDGGDDTLLKVSTLLQRYKIETDVPSNSEERDVSKLHMWAVTSDESIEADDEEGSGYAWKGVELKSPASYAFDEAFNMIKVVLSLVTANFRCRVNSSCGIHVHLGNGPYRMDMQAARNFAALIWAAEPKLSVLHCPSRTTCKFSESSRRLNACNLAAGKGAIDAYKKVLRDPKWMARYQGRARKVGEAPIASSRKLLWYNDRQEQAKDGSFLEPDIDGDSSDYEIESEPFSRPKKVPGHRKQATRKIDLRSQESLPSKNILRRLDDNKLSGGPPQINFPLPETIHQFLRNSQTDETTATIATLEDPKLERPRKPIRERHGPKAIQMSLDSIYGDEAIMSRYPSADIKRQPPVRVGTWSGASELLSCDIGTHQVAYLMGMGTKTYISSNWEGQSKEFLSVLPTMRPTSGNSYMTIESREAGGSLNGEWIATWARIQCRLLEFARDAEPSEFMRIIGLLSQDDGRREAQYDVVDLLEDIGCYAEARYCEERLERGAEAWFDCMLLNHISSDEDDEDDEESSPEPSLGFDEGPDAMYE